MTEGTSENSPQNLPKFTHCQDVSPRLAFGSAQRFRCSLPHGHKDDHELLGSDDDGSMTVLGAWNTTQLSGKVWTKFPTMLAKSINKASFSIDTTSGSVETNYGTPTPRLGWECPRCHSVYAPVVLECKRCAKSSTEDKRPSSEAPTIMTAAEGRAVRAHLRGDSAVHAVVTAPSTMTAAEQVHGKKPFEPRKLSDFLCLRCGTRMTSYHEFEEYQHRTDNCGGLVEYRPAPAPESCGICEAQGRAYCPVHGPF